VVTSNLAYPNLAYPNLACQTEFSDVTLEFLFEPFVTHVAIFLANKQHFFEKGESPMF
jgi:hypothetical protein